MIRVHVLILIYLLTSIDIEIIYIDNVSYMESDVLLLQRKKRVLLAKVEPSYIIAIIVDLVR